MAPNVRILRRAKFLSRRQGYHLKLGIRPTSVEFGLDMIPVGHCLWTSRVPYAHLLQIAWSYPFKLVAGYPIISFRLSCICRNMLHKELFMHLSPAELKFAVTSRGSRLYTLCVGGWILRSAMSHGIDDSVRCTHVFSMFFDDGCR